MDAFSPARDRWVISPLVEAGLDIDHIRDLLVRLAFEAIVTDGRRTVGQVATLVADQPTHVRAAWHETIGRMLQST